jgi:hypothetical protein
MVQSLFYKNQKRIAEEYCVNKSNPQMHCNGKCYLAKELKILSENETSNSSNNQNTNINFKIEPFTFQTVDVNYLSFSPVKKEFSFYRDDSLTTAFIAGIFRPPCVA